MSKYSLFEGYNGKAKQYTGPVIMPNILFRIKNLIVVDILLYSYGLKT